VDEQGNERQDKAIALSVSRYHHFQSTLFRMSSPKIIVIVGATGAQGNSVVATFLKDPSWRVQGITRTTSSAAAKKSLIRALRLLLPTSTMHSLSSRPLRALQSFLLIQTSRTSKVAYFRALSPAYPWTTFCVELTEYHSKDILLED
jgi:hypothetical protein